jgi:hypothetical protein
MAGPTWLRQTSRRTLCPCCSAAELEIYGWFEPFPPRAELPLVAPGSLATLYTSTPARAAALAYSPPWPTSLGGIGLQVRDSSRTVRLAPLLYVSGDQINSWSRRKLCRARQRWKS